MAHFSTTFIDKNNVVGGSGATHSAQAVDQITATYQQFSFGLRWTGADGAVSFGSAPAVALIVASSVATADDTFAPVPAALSPLYVEWSAGTLAGTIKESFYNETTLITSATRDNVDPGFGAVDTSGATAPIGRPGPRYRFELWDIYYRIFIEGDPKPRAVIPVASAGFFFPMVLRMFAPSFVLVHNVTIGGDLLPSSIYTKEAQTLDGVTTPVYMRIYQNSKYPNVQGVPTDLTVA